MRGDDRTMEMSLGSRLRHDWNVFMNRDPTYQNHDYGASSFYRPDRPRFTRGNERTIVTALDLLSKIKLVDKALARDVKDYVNAKKSR